MTSHAASASDLASVASLPPSGVQTPVRATPSTPAVRVTRASSASLRNDFEVEAQRTLATATATASTAPSPSSAPPSSPSPPRFEALTPLIHVYRPPKPKPSASTTARPTPSPSPPQRPSVAVAPLRGVVPPRCVLVCGWMDAPLRVVLKYAVPYATLLPHATVVVLLSRASDFFAAQDKRNAVWEQVLRVLDFETAKEEEERAEARRKGLDGDGVPRGVVVHSFSDGGGANSSNILRLLAERAERLRSPHYLPPHPPTPSSFPSASQRPRGSPTGDGFGGGEVEKRDAVTASHGPTSTANGGVTLPHVRALLLDSSPGTGSARATALAFTVPLVQRGRLTRAYLLRALLYLWVWLGKAWAWLLRRPTVNQLLRRRLNDARLWRPHVARLHAYRAAAAAAAAARRAGQGRVEGAGKTLTDSQVLGASSSSLLTASSSSVFEHVEVGDASASGVAPATAQPQAEQEHRPGTAATTTTSRSELALRRAPTSLCPRAYLYSRADDLIPYRGVESHAAELARLEGLLVDVSGRGAEASDDVGRASSEEDASAGGGLAGERLVVVDMEPTGPSRDGGDDVRGGRGETNAAVISSTAAAVAAATSEGYADQRRVEVERGGARGQVEKLVLLDVRKELLLRAQAHHAQSEHDEPHEATRAAERPVVDPSDASSAAAMTTTTTTTTTMTTSPKLVHLYRWRNASHCDIGRHDAQGYWAAVSHFLREEL